MLISKTTFLMKSFLPLAIVVGALLLAGSSDAQLQVGYYRNSCPAAEAIVRQELTSILSRVPSLAAPLLRMHFHDCFVNGCDGSVLLDAAGGVQAEKDAPPNLSLRGYGVIDRIKSKLEKACPGVVSCADILALAARDAVSLSKGPSWNVPTGRRDGFRSVASDALSNLPPPSASVNQILNQFFIPKGLDIKDLVVLSGAHTIGTAQCSSFSDRLYNFRNTGAPDPLLNANYAARLRNKCRPNDLRTIVEMDPGSYKTFDTKYYKNILKRKGLFTSDQDLLTDGRTRDYVVRQANGPGFEFFNDFGASMIKMGNVGVLTGGQGEVRKQCHAKN